MVIVFRYEKNGEPVERFGFFFCQDCLTAQAMASILLKKLQIMIGHALHKLIAQAYDGAAVLSGV